MSFIPSPRHTSLPDAGGSARAARLTGLLLAALLAGLAASGALTSVVSGLLSGGGGSPVVAASANPYEPDEVVISYTRPAEGLARFIRAQTGIAVSVSSQPTDLAGEAVLKLPMSAGVPAAAAAIAKLPGISYAVPNYIATAAGTQATWVPDDPGLAGQAGGWEKLQWNFLAAKGVNAPEAWANLIGDRRAGARGVVIAVLDSGVAFRDWEDFKRSPDFASTKFVAPCDLVAGSAHNGVCTDPYALDRLGHGTFVAGEIAESTNNGIGVTGLAYNASIMPVRVLDSTGAGSASTIAAGIRYAVQHGAKVINLSLEFPPGTRANQIPDLIGAINYAHNHNVVVVAAAGNDYGTAVDYPAQAPNVIAVGATTADRCLAAYSDVGRSLALVAPGGGDDSSSIDTANCHPTRNLPDVYQMTFPDLGGSGTSVNVGEFVLQSGWFGTSMSAPDVAAAAAMVIASDVLGSDPTPTAILDRLEATARHISGATPNNQYGYGLLDIGAATAKGGPLAPPTTTTTTCTTTTPTGTTTTGTTTTPTGTGTATATTSTSSPCTSTGTTTTATTTTAD